MNDCDECGAHLIDLCPRCGAPVCCPQCCTIDHLCAKVAELEEERIRYERRHNNMVFYSDCNEVGRLEIDQETKTMRFTGNADEAAKVFFESVAGLFNEIEGCR